MTTDPDKIIADIIQNELGLSPGRVVLYDENWDPPKDQGIYVTIQTGSAKRIGLNNSFDPAGDNEIKQVALAGNFTVNITSRDRTAYQRKHEVEMALVSNYSVQQQEAQQCRIFLAGDMLDLSFIEGGSALKRFQIPVIMHYLMTKTTAIPVFDQQEQTQTEVQST